MSVWSMRRRVSIVITGMVIIVFIVGISLFALLYSPESCNDGILNGGEFGIDCGGVCPNECPVPPKKLLDVWTRAFKIADGVYSAVAYIENQNENLYVPSVQFEIVLYGAENEIITRTSQRTVISANGVTPIFVPHIITGTRTAERAVFRFTEEPVFAMSRSNHMFEISDILISAPDNASPAVSAIVTNIGEKTVRKADFVVIVYDEESNAVGASRTFQRYIGSGESRQLQYTWVHPFKLRKGICPGGLCVKEVKQVEIIPIVLE